MMALICADMNPVSRSDEIVGGWLDLVGPEGFRHFCDLVGFNVKQLKRFGGYINMFNLRHETAKLYGYELTDSPAEVIKEVLGYPDVSRDWEVRQQLEKAAGQIASGNRKEAARTLKILVMTEGMNALASNQTAHEQVKALIDKLDFNFEKEQAKMYSEPKA